MIFFLQGYQFWTKANDKGFFSISGIRPGIYNVYAWVPGFIGDYRHDAEITITPGLVLLFFYFYSIICSSFCFLLLVCKNIDTSNITFYTFSVFT